MSTLTIVPSNATAPTQFLQVKNETYAYRRFGGGSAHPLVCLQHFTGNLDNWDPAITDILASGREVILFDNAGIGRSTGKVPETVQGMATHALAFLDALGLERVDLLGFSLGGMVAQEIALARPSLVRKMLLVGTAPEGGEEIMHLENPKLKQIFASNLTAPQRLVKLFFAPSASSQAAGEAFIARLAQRDRDREPVSGPEVAKAQIAAFRAWESFAGERFAKRRVRHLNPGQKFLSAERALAERRATYLSRLRARVPVSVSRVFYEASGHIPRVGVGVCAY
jgi:pimeloyl-ACP methyl ester carboxylesterase